MTTDRLVSRAFRRRVGDAPMVTACVPVSADLSKHPMVVPFRKALANWYRAPTGLCLVCKNEVGPPSMWLLAASTTRKGTSLACAICAPCARADDPDALEFAATQTLRKVIPDGRFDPETKTARAGVPSGP